MGWLGDLFSFGPSPAEVQAVREAASNERANKLARAHNPAALKELLERERDRAHDLVEGDKTAREIGESLDLIDDITKAIEIQRPWYSSVS